MKFATFEWARPRPADVIRGSAGGGDLHVPSMISYKAAEEILAEAEDDRVVLREIRDLLREIVRKLP